MRHIFKNPNRRGMDEMERHILFRAQRNAYLFLVAALVVWSFYESIRVYALHCRLDPRPCLLLAAAMLVQAFSQLALSRRAVKDDEDSWETGPLMRLVLLACVAAAAAVTVGAAVVLMGVRA